MNDRDALIKKCAALAREMRQNALALANRAGNNGAHLGGGLSIVEIMATLYGAILKFKPDNPRWEQRDRFILSKGHGTLGYYTALAGAHLITRDQLFTFEQNGGQLPGQPSVNLDLGIEYSSGSLGMGLAYAVGICLALIRQNSPSQVYVLLGDGECNEGSVWESAMAAAHFRLANLTAIIDHNSMQSDGRTGEILDVDLVRMWQGLGWEVARAAGHDVASLYEAFSAPRRAAGPRVLIAATVKGKGVSFMENNNEWHHNRLTREQYEAALAELPRDQAQ